MSLRGRNHLAYQDELRKARGLFGGQYAVEGDFLRRMHERNIRLPEDLIGDDGLIAALAATDLRGDAYWDRERVEPCEAAGFYCEPADFLNPFKMRTQYARISNYSSRRFKNQIISPAITTQGQHGLPARTAPSFSAPSPSF